MDNTTIGNMIKERENAVKSKWPIVIFSGVAHVLAWAALLWLAFWPYSYSGTSTTPIGPDGSGGQVVTNLSASLIEVNGWGVLIPLAVPVILTAVGLVAALAGERPRTWQKLIMWIAAILLVVFCGLGMFSIGMFCLPSALALLAAAIIFSFQPKDVAHQVDGA